MDANEISHVIAKNDYDRFKQLVNSGFDVSQRIFDNNTLLHLLACANWKLSTPQFVVSICRNTATVFDWLRQIKNSMPNTISLKEFFTQQNDKSHTCMHLAITNENWIFAHAVLAEFHISYHLEPGLYRRDQGGLTEPERFLILYGIQGREKEFEMLFDKVQCSILTIKSASKAFKIVKFSHEKFVVLPSTHRFYKSATELNYPLPYADFDDPFILEQIYEENGLIDPAKKSRERKRLKMQNVIDSIYYDGCLDEEPVHVLAFLKSYVDALWSWNRDENYIITCAREFCNEIPSFYMVNLKEDVVSDLSKLSKLAEFSQHASVISKLIVKFRSLRRENE